MRILIKFIIRDRDSSAADEVHIHSVPKRKLQEYRDFIQNSIRDNDNFEDRTELMNEFCCNPKKYVKGVKIATIDQEIIDW